MSIRQINVEEFIKGLNSRIENEARAIDELKALLGRRNVDLASMKLAGGEFKLALVDGSNQDDAYRLIKLIVNMLTVDVELSKAIREELSRLSGLNLVIYPISQYGLYTHLLLGSS